MVSPVGSSLRQGLWNQSKCVGDETFILYSDSGDPARSSNSTSSPAGTILPDCSHFIAETADNQNRDRRTSRHSAKESVDRRNPPKPTSKISGMPIGILCHFPIRTTIVSGQAETSGDNNMTKTHFQALTLCLLGLAAASGCTSIGSTTVRGQGPEYCPPGEIEQTGYGKNLPGIKAERAALAVRSHDQTRLMREGIHGSVQQCDPYQSVKSGIHDAYHFSHNTHTTYYHQNSSMGGYPGGYGLMQQPWCPQGGWGCPNGQCGNNLDWYPRHGFTYSYERPNDLVYPPAGGIGGAVVYPYYTHKGPSDFFRDK